MQTTLQALFRSTIILELWYMVLEALAVTHEGYISTSLAQKRTFTPVKLSKDVIIFTCCHKLAINKGVTNTCQLFMGSK